MLHLKWKIAKVRFNGQWLISRFCGSTLENHIRYQVYIYQIYSAILTGIYFVRWCFCVFDVNSAVVVGVVVNRVTWPIAEPCGAVARRTRTVARGFVDLRHHLRSHSRLMKWCATALPARVRSYLNYDHGLQDAHLRSFVAGSESSFIPQLTTEWGLGGAELVRRLRDRSLWGRLNKTCPGWVRKQRLLTQASTPELNWSTRYWSDTPSSLIEGFGWGFSTFVLSVIK